MYSNPELDWILTDIWQTLDTVILCLLFLDPTNDPIPALTPAPTQTPTPTETSEGQ